MKIVFGTSLDRITEHAKFVVKEAQAKSREPIGVPCYTAQVPEVCSDCGATFWHGNDPYQFYPHIGCKSGKAMGF